MREFFRKKPKVLVASLIGAVLLLGALIYLLVSLNSPADSSLTATSPETNPQISAPGKDPAETNASEEAMELLEITPQTKAEIRETFEDVRTNLKDNIAPGTQTLAGETEVEKIFPPGSRIEILENTWTQVEENIVYVQVIFHQPHKDPHPYTAIVVRLQGKWKIVATLESQETPAGAQKQDGSDASKPTSEGADTPAPITIEAPQGR